MSDTITYTAYLDGRLYDRNEHGEQLLADAHAKFGMLTEACGDNATLTVFKGAELVAWRSNRRIEATFEKQRMAAAAGHDTVDCGSEPFDATAEVLLLTLEEIRGLEKDLQLAETVGRAHVAWDGACSVTGLPAALKHYFGVHDLDDITQAHLRLARAKEEPQAKTKRVMELTIKVEVWAGVGSLQSFVDNLDYTIESNTPGVVVFETALVRARSARPQSAIRQAES